MDEALKDERFSHILKDPRFRKIPRNVRKIKVDKRFKDMFSDKQFNEKSKLDERGRSLNLTSSENLKKLYNVTTDSSEEDGDESEKIENISEATSSQMSVKAEKLEIDKETKAVKAIKRNKQQKNVEKEKIKDFESDESEESDEDLQGSSVSSSEDSDEDETEGSGSENDDEFDHHWEELHKEAPDTDEITSRIAVCNMDWDRIRAEDLYTVFNSFKPADSCVHSVKIYPSDFGLKRMEEEKLNGPQELVEETLDPDEEEVETKKGSRYHREKLRQYQINRLRYYYAVVACDTSETANSLYEQLNGMEYESSSIRFDLRFIPDDVTFDHDPTSVADKIPDPTEYKPRLFVTSALQQVKVNLTWDETDPKRRETLQKAFTEPDTIEKDIKDYLASSSGESEEEQEGDESDGGSKVSTKDRIEKYKALLQSLEENEKDEKEKYEMEITWDSSLKDKTEKLVKQKMEDTTTPFEEILKKKKERKRQKQKKVADNEDQDDEKSLASEESDSEFFTKGTDSKQLKDSKKLDELYLISDSKKMIDQPQETKSKRKKDKKLKVEKLDQFKCNVADPRFSAVYSSHEYNIDPSDPHFKKTDGTLAIIQEKQKRLKNKHSSNERKYSKRFKYC